MSERLTEEQIQRATEIVREFTSWTPETGPCPISINDRHWFMKLCALAERLAVAESTPLSCLALGGEDAD